MCIVLALGYMHGQRVLHRDIKPENLLLDDTGQLRITDLGVSGELDEDGWCFSTSGTRPYMAPEVFMSGHKHGVPSDYYSLGITLHQFLTGQRPYRATRSNLKNIVKMAAYVPPSSVKDRAHARRVLASAQERKAQSEEFHISRRLRGISPEGIDFVRSLLVCNASFRLGTAGVQEVLSHPWLAGMDIEGIRKETTPAPFRPDMSHAQCNVYDSDLAHLLLHGDDSAPTLPTLLPEEQAKFVGYDFNTCSDNRRLPIAASEPRPSEIKRSREAQTRTEHTAASSVGTHGGRGSGPGSASAMSAVSTLRADASSGARSRPVLATTSRSSQLKPGTSAALPRPTPQSPAAATQSRSRNVHAKVKHSAVAPASFDPSHPDHPDRFGGAVAGPADKKTPHGRPRSQSMGSTGSAGSHSRQDQSGKKHKAAKDASTPDSSKRDLRETRSAGLLLQGSTSAQPIAHAPTSEGGTRPSGTPMVRPAHTPSSGPRQAHNATAAAGKALAGARATAATDSSKPATHGLSTGDAIAATSPQAHTLVVSSGRTGVGGAARPSPSSVGARKPDSHGGPQLTPEPSSQAFRSMGLSNRGDSIGPSSMQRHASLVGRAAIESRAGSFVSRGSLLASSHGPDIVSMPGSLASMASFIGDHPRRDASTRGMRKPRLGEGVDIRAGARVTESDDDSSNSQSANVFVVNQVGGSGFMTAHGLGIGGSDSDVTALDDSGAAPKARASAASAAAAGAAQSQHSQAFPTRKPALTGVAPMAVVSEGPERTPDTSTRLSGVPRSAAD